jgi:general L-amino acid transport system substrate-binding protein
MTARIRIVTASLLALSMLLAGVANFAAALAAAPADVLEAVRSRGHISCGVTEGAVGFSIQDRSGRWQGMNVDLCRALAAAVLGDHTKVEFVPVPSSRRFVALREGEIDLLARMNPWTFSSAMDPATTFVAPLYHGGYGFLTRKSNGLTSALELTGATVCLLSGSMADQSAAAFFTHYGMKYEAVSSETWADTVKAYLSGRCLVIVSDHVTLASARNEMPDATAHALLPEIVGAETFGPVVAAGQERWANIVRWTIFGLIAAEKHGVGRDTVEAARTSPRTQPEARRLLGIEGGTGEALGLAETWLAVAIGQVGNYGEIFERNLGMKSLLQLRRGRNALVENGGIFIAPSFR